MRYISEPVKSSQAFSSALLILASLLLWEESSGGKIRNEKDSSGFFLKTSTVLKMAFSLRSKKILSETPRGRGGLHCNRTLGASPDTEVRGISTHGCRATAVSTLWPLGGTKMLWRGWFCFGRSKRALSSWVASRVWLWRWVFSEVVSLATSLGRWPPALRYWISSKERKMC